MNPDSLRELEIYKTHHTVGCRESTDDYDSARMMVVAAMIDAEGSDQ